MATRCAIELFARRPRCFTRARRRCHLALRCRSRTLKRRAVRRHWRIGSAGWLALRVARTGHAAIGPSGLYLASIGLAEQVMRLTARGRTAHRNRTGGQVAYLLRRGLRRAVDKAIAARMN